jgi:D-arabinose 1-dehydrogenase-like Zn-dependent alcohol dehydrogenase
MKAAVLQAFGQPLALLDLPTPTPLADEVLLAVEACGVCHSNLHIVDGDSPAFKAGTKAQLIPGHEVVAIDVADDKLAAARAQGAAHAFDARDDLRATLGPAAAGKLRCLCHTRPLAEANQALEDLRAGGLQGRTVLIPGTKPA